MIPERPEQRGHAGHGIVGGHPDLFGGGIARIVDVVPLEREGIAQIVGMRLEGGAQTSGGVGVAADRGWSSSGGHRR